MATFAHLWPVDPPAGITVNGVLSGIQSSAQQFTAAVTGYLAGLRWYRGATGSGIAPTRLSLWDVTTSSEVYATTSIPDTGLVGWQLHEVIQSVLFVAGRQYRVAACWPNGTTFYYTTTLPTPDSPLVFAVSPRYYNSGSCAFPNSQNAGTDYEPADAIWTDVNPGTDPPATEEGVASELASWLISTGDNTHQTDGLPWLIKTELDATKIIAQGALDVLTDPDGSPQSLTAFGLAMTGPIVAAISTFFTSSNGRLTGTTAAGGTAFETSDGRRATDLVAQIWSATTPARSLPPGAGWTLVDETDWDTTLAWNVGAHCYLVTVDSYPPAQPATSSPAGTWLYRLGWWTPLNGTYAGQRSFLEFGQQYLYQNGLWMPGVALQVRAATTGSVQAWVTG